MTCISDAATSRTRRAFTYLEAAIVMALMAVGLTLAAGQIGTPDNAGSSRRAQGTVETVLDVTLDHRFDRPAVKFSS